MINKVPHPNYLKRALYYQEVIDSGKVESQAQFSEYLGISRPMVSLILRLLKLDDEIKSFILSLDDTDKRHKILTEHQLRPLLQIKDREIQRAIFWEMIGGEGKN